MKSRANLPSVKDMQSRQTTCIELINRYIRHRFGDSKASTALMVAHDTSMSVVKSTIDSQQIETDEETSSSNSPYQLKSDFAYLYFFKTTKGKDVSYDYEQEFDDFTNKVIHVSSNRSACLFVNKLK